MSDLHHPEYEGIVEDNVPVHELHKAKCNLCSWEGEEHDEFDWKGAEEEAVEHYQELHAEANEDDEDEDEDEDEEDDEDAESLTMEEANDTGDRWFAYKQACKAKGREPMAWGAWMNAGQPVPAES